MDKEFLDIAVNEAIGRIRRGYDMTNGKIFLSFSGGKDSTVVAELIKMANLPVNIPFVFADTRIELDATTDFVKEYEYENKVFLKPRKPFGQILKEYGKPIISKERSGHLATYQRNIDTPYSTCSSRKLITAKAEKGGVIIEGAYARSALAKKHFHLLHPELDYKIANMCCEYMKKKPFKDYSKETGMKGTFTGIRVAEGGIRSIKYTSCTVMRKGGKETLVMPIYDWSDELTDYFVKVYNVKLSKAYTEYGMKRTGCIGCPFNRDLPKDLEILKEKEPKKYKACITWLKDVYVDSGFKLEFDEEYMKYYEERSKINEIRRLEMLEKFGRK